MANESLVWSLPFDIAVSVLIIRGYSRDDAEALVMLARQDMGIE